MKFFVVFLSPSGHPGMLPDIFSPFVKIPVAPMIVGMELLLLLVVVVVVVVVVVLLIITARQPW
jgi:hypothetical protein